ISVSEDQKIIAQLLRDGKKVCVLVGIQGFNHPESAEVRTLAQHIASSCNGTLGFLTEGANAAGAWIAGAIPHRTAAAKVEQAGLDALAMWTNPRKAYVLLNVEPELDCANA